MAYPGAAAVNAGFKWTATLTSEFAIAADRNPGVNGATGSTEMGLTTTSSGKQLKAGNSMNHQQVGQNILYGDLHAEFQQSPFAGVQQDNIYASGALAGTAPNQYVNPVAVSVGAGPAHQFDSALAPTAN